MDGKPFSDASLTLAPPKSCSPENATTAWYRLLRSFKVLPDSVEILDRTFDPVGDDHRPRLAANLPLGEDLFVEMVHHDLGLEDG